MPPPSTISPTPLTPTLRTQEEAAPEQVKLAPLRTLRFDDYVTAPSGATYHGVSMRLLSGLSPPKPLTSAPKAALAVLPGVEPQPITVDASGRLGMDGNYKSGEELSAIVGLAALGLADPFSSIRDPQMLAALAGRLSSVATALQANTSQNDQDALQARSAVLSLLLCVALRAQTLSLHALHDKLARLFGECLTGADPELRQFYTEAARTAVNKGEAPAFVNAPWLPDVSAPPYAQWEKDKVIRAQIYIDNNGTPVERIETHIGRMGFTLKQTRADGSKVYRKEASRSGALPMEVVLAQQNGRPPLFEKMNDAATDFVVYAGHAGYGATVREALQSGQTLGNGTGKLLVLLQCSGIYSAGEITQTLPQLQLVSTTRMTSDATDMPMLEALFAGFETRADWAAIHRSVQKSIADIGTKDWARHYFYPNQAEQGSNVDRDQDGVADAQDRLFSVTLTDTQPNLAVLAGRSKTLAAMSTNGRTLTRAIEDTSLVLRNCPMFDSATERALGWSAPILSDGLFDAGTNDEACRFRIDEQGRVHVAMSVRYATASQAIVTQIFAIELARFMAARGKLQAREATALALSFIERIRHQAKIERDAFDEGLLFARYGLNAGAAEFAMLAAGNPDDFAAEHFNKIRASLGKERLANNASLPMVREGKTSAEPWNAAALALSFGWPDAMLSSLSGGFVMLRSGKLVEVKAWQEGSKTLAIEQETSPSAVAREKLTQAGIQDEGKKAALATNLRDHLRDSPSLADALVASALASGFTSEELRQLGTTLDEAYSHLFYFQITPLTITSVRAYVNAYSHALRNRGERGAAMAALDALVATLSPEQKRANADKLVDANSQTPRDEAPSATLQRLGITVADTTLTAIYAEHRLPVPAAVLAQLSRTGSAEQQILAAIKLARQTVPSAQFPWLVTRFVSSEERQRIETALL
jgi:hypothetical protein